MTDFPRMIDITAPKAEVEVIVGASEHDGHVIWVNIDGICRLRICRIPSHVIKVEDRRVGKSR
jgi:hypothetical protein